VRLHPLYPRTVTVDRAGGGAARRLPPADDGRCGPARHGRGRACLFDVPGSPTLKTLLVADLKPTVLRRAAWPRRRVPRPGAINLLPDLMSAGRVVLGLKGAAKRSVFEREAQGDPAVQPIAALIAAKVLLEVVWTEVGRWRCDPVVAEAAARIVEQLVASRDRLHSPHGRGAETPASAAPSCPAPTGPMPSRDRRSRTS